MSFFSPRIGLKNLARLCRQLSTSLAAGIDVRKVWQREAERALPPAKSRFQLIATEVAAGNSTASALEKTGDFFPDIFRELTDVGEQSGRLSEVYNQMAQHYDHQLELRRQFYKAISWPMIQLTAAVFIVGILIYAMGIIATMNQGKPIDMLGFGLFGARGLKIYFAFIASVVLVVAVLIRAVVRGGFWSGPLQMFLWRIPVLGPALRTLALSRFTWSLYMTQEAGMELKKAMTLSLRSTRSVELIGLTPQINLGIQQGREINEVLRDTRMFSPEFLDAVEVGEHSGQLVETLELLTRQQQESARASFGILTTIGGFLVWAVVAAIIVMIIIRIFSMYVGMIDQAMH